MTGRRKLNIKYKDNKVIIRFPVSYTTLLFHLFFFFLVVLKFGVYPEGESTRNTVISYTCFGIGTVSIIMMYMRKLTINKKERIMVYYSYFKRTFEYSDIVFMESIFDTAAGESGRCYLQIQLKSRIIKIKTQSEEQNKMLLSEIEALMNSCDSI